MGRRWAELRETKNPLSIIGGLKGDNKSTNRERGKVHDLGQNKKEKDN